MNAYVTLLCSDDYLEGVLCLALSLRDTLPCHPLHVLTNGELCPTTLATLEQFGLPTIEVGNRFSLPKEILARGAVARWHQTFLKLEIFELIQFDRVVYLDGDMLITANIDALFGAPHPSAVVYHGHLPPFADWYFPNSGMLVITPRAGLGEAIFACWPEVAAEQDSMSDQLLIHRYFTKIFEQSRGEWELPVRYNSCAFMLDKIIRAYRLNFYVDKPDDKTIAVVHFSSHNKPWATSLGFRIKFLTKKFLGRKWNELRAYRRYHFYLNKVRKIVSEV